MPSERILVSLTGRECFQMKVAGVAWELLSRFFLLTVGARSWRRASLGRLRNACRPARMKSGQLEGNTLTADPVRHGLTKGADDTVIRRSSP